MVLYKVSSVVRSRLNPSPEEVDPFQAVRARPLRNWSPLPIPLHDSYIGVPLLRTWDHVSGSQPDPETGHMFARDPEQRLHTDEVRRETLELHLNHGNWEVPTPYISFQASEDSLRTLADFRRTRPSRKRQTITVIDPEVRLRTGWPVRCVGDEMRHYGIDRDPYGNLPQAHDSHYVCLWRVEKEEIVGRWDWDELRQIPDWYNAVILPEFRRVRRERREHEEEMERQQALADSQLGDILPAMSALGLDDAVAGPSSSEQPSPQWSDQPEDSGIESEDEPEEVNVRAML